MEPSQGLGVGPQRTNRFGGKPQDALGLTDPWCRWQGEVTSIGRCSLGRSFVEPDEEKGFNTENGRGC